MQRSPLAELEFLRVPQKGEAGVVIVVYIHTGTWFPIRGPLLCFTTGSVCSYPAVAVCMGRRLLFARESRAYYLYYKRMRVSNFDAAKKSRTTLLTRTTINNAAINNNR